MQLLLLTSTAYSSDLSYEVDGGSSIDLDEPQLFAGLGAVGLLNTTQNQFVFTNDGVTEASVEILVGRTAT